MRLLERPGRWLIILPPLLFLTVFFLIPFAFAFKISLAETAPRVPPFTDIFTHTRGRPSAAVRQPRELQVPAHR